MMGDRTILDDILDAVRAVGRKVDRMSEMPADIQAGLTALPTTTQQAVAYIEQLRAENAALRAQMQQFASLNTQLQAALPPQTAVSSPEQPTPAIDPAPAEGQPVQPQPQ